MRKYSAPEAIARIQRYCAYQERSHQEVRNKLFEYGLYSSDVDEILTQLITSNFLNEERYARAFAGGKFRMKKWGRIKIVHALESQGLSPKCIQLGLKEIDPADYEKTLTALLEKKNETEDEANLYARRDKLSKFAMLKGFEPDLVWRVLKQLLPDQR